MKPVFSSLYLRGWRQFGAIDINFHPRLTILTGINGTGKSTVLKILAGQFLHSWVGRFTATPALSDGRFIYSSDARDTYRDSGLPGTERRSKPRINIGAIVQSPNIVTVLAVPKQPSNQYEVARSEDLQLQKESFTPTYGFYLPSHRVNASYAHISSVPTQPYTSRSAFAENVSSVRAANEDLEEADLRSPHHQRKRTLISMNVFPETGPTSNVVTTFDNALRIMLPPNLRYKKLDFRGAEVVLETERGDFALDSLSGGLESIVDLLWQCSLIADFADEFAVILDEPENHLHPEMQRVLLPNFLASFPTAQFIVATHNPLVATSVEDSSLYFFSYDDSGFVTSRLADNSAKTGTSDEALRAFFGLSSSIPTWVQSKLELIWRKYGDKKLDSDLVKELKAEMKGLQLDEYIPDTLLNLAEEAERESGD
jgi:predicted ATPase